MLPYSFILSHKDLEMQESHFSVLLFKKYTMITSAVLTLQKYLEILLQDLFLYFWNTKSGSILIGYYRVLLVKILFMKKNGIMSFAGKWIQMTIIICSKINQLRKACAPCFPSFVGLECRLIHKITFVYRTR